MDNVLEFGKLSLAEKLRAMESLWDGLRSNESEVPTPQWHQDLLAERERLVREGKAHFSDWSVARQRILRAVS